jgi:hypothetical protein
VIEAKGLEFDDIILFNFFNSVNNKEFSLIFANIELESEIIFTSEVESMLKKQDKPSS